MDIKYLKKYDSNKTDYKLSKNSNPRGLTQHRIEELEIELNKGKPFPKAFREFLYVGGGYNAIGLSAWYDIDWENIELGENYIQQIEVYKKLMAKEGLSLNRPFVVINSHDDSGFAFIYLDEGDDPRPMHFALDPYIIKTDGQIFPFPEKTFSELIDRLVDHALRGLVPF